MPREGKDRKGGGGEGAESLQTNMRDESGEWGGGVVRRESARNQKKMAKEAGWQVKCIPPTTNNNNNNKLA